MKPRLKCSFFDRGSLNAGRDGDASVVGFEVGFNRGLSDVSMSVWVAVAAISLSTS
ncbi:MAG: hypothetical protein R2706_01525 [Acidimicrobiales bacterium]